MGLGSKAAGEPERLKKGAEKGDALEGEIGLVNTFPETLYWNPKFYARPLGPPGSPGARETGDPQRA